MSEKNQYIEKAKARIAQWDAEIDKMKAKADEAEADAKIEYQKQLSEMRTQRDETFCCCTPFRLVRAQREENLLLFPTS